MPWGSLRVGGRGAGRRISMMIYLRDFKLQITATSFNVKFEILKFEMDILPFIAI